MTLNHIWSFLCFLTAVSAVIVKYPSINGSEALNCECPDHQCQRVYWYRLPKNRDTPEFLMYTTLFNNPQYAKNIEENRFKSNIIDSSKVLFTLRITGIQEKDAGVYACLLSSSNSAQDPKDLMPEGYSIRPGESLPTLPPTTLKNPKRVNRLPNICKSNHQSPKGCKSLVLWSGIAAVLLLVVVLISTLYYFSRLPKKCRHRFAKKQQL